MCVENDEMGRWKFHSLAPVQVYFFRKIRIYIGHIKQKPQRQVWTVSGLMLVKVHAFVNEKGNIIVHRHVNRILQGIHHQVIRVCVIRSIDRVVQLQKVLSCH